MKNCAQQLVPVIAKLALVISLLKKIDLDLVFNSFRPVSNLLFVSKKAERSVIPQLLEHCNINALLPSNQPFYPQHHSMETVLLRVHNDILLNTDKQEVTWLFLLDLSSDFNTIDHGMMAPRYWKTTLVLPTALSVGLSPSLLLGGSV